MEKDESKIRYYKNFFKNKEEKELRVPKKIKKGFIQALKNKEKEEIREKKLKHTTFKIDFQKNKV